MSEHLVEQVAGDELELVLDVGDALEVHGARAPHHADHRVALRQQEFRQVGPVLAGDARDQSPLRHRGKTLVDRRTALPARLQCRRADGMHGLLPPGRGRRGRRRGRQMGGCAGPARMGRAHRRRVGPGGHRPARVGDRRARAPDPGRGRGRAGRRRPRDRREPLLAAAQPRVRRPSSRPRAPGDRRSCTITTCRGSGRTSPTSRRRRTTRHGRT